jgi:hypothetical protein
MFDIRDYYSRESSDSRRENPLSSIEEEVYGNVSEIISSRFDPLYRTDTYRYESGSVTIYSPARQFDSMGLLPTSDRVRSLLSLYPDRENLKAIRNLILRPRYVETAGTELMALYLPEGKTLVTYLFDRERFSGKISTRKLRTGNLTPADHPEPENHSGIKGDPLWYVLSILAENRPDRTHSFCFTHDVQNSPSYRELIDLSCIYSRNGY